jgi:hypothetical protein
MTQSSTEELTELLTGYDPAATQIIRTQQMMSGYAGEAVRVTRTPGHLYVYGSDVAVLRIFAHYNMNGMRYNPRVRIHRNREDGTRYLVIKLGPLPKESNHGSI